MLLNTVHNVDRKNRAMQHDCDLDVADKHHAQGIDDMAHQLRNRSCKIGFHPGVEKQDNTFVLYTRTDSVTIRYDSRV